MIFDLRNTKTAKLRWCHIVWDTFEEPRLVTVYATSMQTNWDYPSELMFK